MFLEKFITLRTKTLNILGYLSQSLLRNRDLFYDAEAIWGELGALGYSERDIEDALCHIERGFETLGPFWSENIPVYRSYSMDEKTQLPNRARTYLFRLKCRGIIDHALEDEIIAKAMQLEEPVGLREIKTVAALTVFGYEHRLQDDGVNPINQRFN